MAMFNYQVAFTRDLPDAFFKCLTLHELNHPIDVQLAKKQHDKYTETIRSLVTRHYQVPADEQCPDCCFIEDPVFIVGRKVLINNLKAPTRQPEVIGIKKLFSKLQNEGEIEEMEEMQSPSCVDGGDVLLTGKEIFVGLSARTNMDGVKAIQKAFPNHKVRAFEVSSVLHLKSMMSAMDENTIVMPDVPEGHKLAKEITEGDEEYQILYVPDVIAANVLRIGNTIIIQDGFPLSEKILRKAAEERNLNVITLQMSELIKGDGALTCCSAFLSSDLSSFES